MTLTKILAIDDDENLLRIVSAGLEREGYQVLTVRSALEGLRAAFSIHPDLAIVDIMMPGMDGLELARRLREFSGIPILMLTALSSTADVVKGLQAGADDYITKPFDMAELIARIQACLRRQRTPTAARPTIMIRGKLVIDMARHKVSVEGKTVTLTPTEFRLLSCLALHIGHVVPHRTLLVEVWGPEYTDQVNYLHLYIRHLREKLEADPGQPEFIRSERSIGYFLEEA